MCSVFSLRRIIVRREIRNTEENVGISTTTPKASSILHVVSTNKGILIPRMTLVQRNAIASPAVGLLVYITDRAGGFFVEM